MAILWTNEKLNLLVLKEGNLKLNQMEDAGIQRVALTDKIDSAFLNPQGGFLVGLQVSDCRLIAVVAK